MALQIVEFFGYAPADKSAAAVAARRNLACPFAGGPCTKTLRGDGGAKLVGGVCTVRQATPNPIICCPKRLYAEEYRVLQDIADSVFGPGMPILPGNQINHGTKTGDRVFAFGSAPGG